MPSPRAKVPPYLLMLVVSFALLALIGYQTVKDRKVSGDLLKQKDSLLQEKTVVAQKLDGLLQKEKKKSSDLQERLNKLSSQKDKLSGLKDGLSGQLIQLENAKRLTEKDKKKLESSLSDKEDEIKDLKDKLALADENEEKLKVLLKETTEKDAEINELKLQIKALGGHVNEKLVAESANSSRHPDDELAGGHEKEISKQESNDGKGITEKVLEEEERAKNLEGKASSEKHSEGQAEGSKKKDDEQSLDVEDEETRVDDREDTSANDDIGEEADAEKIREEEEAEEQPEVDMDAVNKTDLDENEIAAME